MASATRQRELRIIPVRFPGEICAGDSIANKLLSAMQHQRISLARGDILVVKHKIISKAEGKFVKLDTIRPSAASRAWGKRHGVDARVIELALGESRSVIRQKAGVLITETRHGLICANSGVDVSNVDGGRHALLLPEDPDASARRLHRELKKRLRLSIPVIISDTSGRPWREGLTEVAIGLAAMKPLRDDRKRRDPDGYKLRVSQEAVADELACTAGLVCGKLERTPACIIRGFAYEGGSGSARAMIRPASKDLFR